MHWYKLAAGLMSVASVAEGRRSFQHVGKREPTPKSTHLDGESALEHFLATRQVPAAKFANANTTKYAVNGTGIPDVDFDAGESYSGYLPITDNPDDTDELFFWFFPSSATNFTEKEILLWLNGGPGCSSFEGLIQENGPFIWQYGTLKPVPNPWSWNRLTNVVWVEQPIGTGFSRGKVTATSEEDVAAQFLGFWKNFIDLFELQGYKVYIAGESYAGAYCPYIASAMLDKNDTAYYNVSGMMIYDPVLGDGVVQDSVTTVPFVDYHHNLMSFNDSFSAYIHGLHDSCGFADYNDKYLVYPPSGPQPPDYSDSVSRECRNLWSDVLNEALSINPCFDVYQVATTCPLLWDILGFPGTIDYLPEGGSIYFNRTDVKTAIHADLDTTWEACASSNVFVGGDSSDPSSWVVLPHVIDATQNVIIGHGSLDMILLPNGTLLTIQNTTWGGKLGFQSAPTEPFFVPFHTLSTADDIQSSTDEVALGSIAAAGVLGTAHTERGLTYVSVDLSGHMIPQYAPSAAFRQLEFLLGRVDSLSSLQPFTTEPDYPQPPASSLGNGTGPATYSSGSANKSSDGSDTQASKKSSAAKLRIRGVGAAAAAGAAVMGY
ncbi:alpha/beta-hydrolase [Annulohypoxylon maeteangense]|uniref:alpha/beta-hydrolase n=1 Tax=Annulohypoxylon maeteangense TaxID=1927788 RepID=UPI002008AAEA|nr:alpha/beta-hydrolase [Annulohypoxylon maeteangense]KAI0880249.1 alpha/beta-hydrolase [Annulohypoxylon maeteangense]